jgi:pilus assembly protein CpaF
VPLETRPQPPDGRGEIRSATARRAPHASRPHRGGQYAACDAAAAGDEHGPRRIASAIRQSPRECLQRLEVMVLMAGYDLPVKAIRQQIGTAINVFVQVARLSDGTRKVVRVSEIVGMEGDQLQLQDMFEFVQTGVTPEGRVQGQFRASGLRSRYFDRMVTSGVKPEDILSRER